MNFKMQASPHIRINNANVANMMWNVLIALIPVIFVSVYVYKLEFIVALVISIISVCGSEYLANKIMKREQTLNDYSGLVTAVIFALTLPSGIFSAKFYGSGIEAFFIGTFIIVASAVFGTVVGKMVFGGVGRNIFNVAGLGRIFMIVSFGAILSYFSDSVNYISSATPLGTIKNGLINNSIADINAFNDSSQIYELFIGRNIGGSFGEVSAIAILLGAIYLIAYKIADWRKIAAGLGSFILFVLVYTLRMDLPLSFVLVELFSGSILFGMVYMVTDPVTAPITAPGRVFYAIMIAGITFAIRIFGAYPEGMLFAILIMNMFAPIIDYYRWTSTKFTRGWIITILVTLIAFVAIVIIGT